MLKQTGHRLADLLRGMLLPFRAVVILLREPRYWPYVLLPILLGALLYAAGSGLGWYYAMPRLEGVLPAEWQNSTWGNVLYLTLLWLIRLAAGALLLTLFLFTFTTVCLIIGAPIVDKLAEVFERRQYGFDFRCPTWRVWCRYNWTSMINTTRIGVIILFWTLVLFPISLLLPGPGFLLPAAVVGYYFGITTLIYASEHRRIHYRTFRRQLHGSRLMILGMGTVFYLMMLIPFAAVLLMPIAVLAGTMLYHEAVLPRNTPDLDATPSPQIPAPPEEK
ncbi:MAG: EI24 domain-containing protein [Victivallales bacterium]|nr:EI24 domain-containing protein [Victivallales bacterium]